MHRSELIAAQHLAKEAIVYIRQSTQHQILTNHESLDLQYALKQRALDLGWGIDNIQIIDADLGISGASTEKREGFKEVLTKVTLGKVGIILSYDVTRLSRNCSDWYPLLDICGYKQCLIADRDGIYDAGTTNGRLLLGLKGQLAEMELSTIRARLTAGLLNKAQRGELALRLPTGFVRNPHKDVQKDPNIEVQNRINLIFDVFLEKKSAAKVLRYFSEHKLTIPRLNDFGELKWREATIASITSILRSPVYAGAFVYGKTRVKRGMNSSDKTTMKVPMEEWKVLVKDKYPKYIDWETFEKIQGILKDNYAEYNHNKTRGIPRPGAALLQGIVYCGECGHKMVVQYKQGNRYLCNYLHRHRRTPICQYLPADPIDDYVIKQFFEALKPIELDAYTQSIQSEKVLEQKLEKTYKQQLDHLRYEAKLAERQFNQVDPDNRLVAAELERRWEEALNAIKESESVFDEKKQIKPMPQLSPELREVFLSICKNLPLIWDSGTLSREQKKAFIRCLIDKIVTHRVKSDYLQVRIVWRGGETTTSEVLVTIGAFAKLSMSKEMEDAIVELSKTGKTDEEIAKFLTQQGYHSPKKRCVLVSTVRIIRLKHKIFVKQYRSREIKVDGYLTVPQIAKTIVVTKQWIYDNINRGKIKIRKDKDTANGKYLFEDTPKTVNMFKGLRSGKLQTLNFL